MSQLIRLTDISLPRARSVAFATLIGATFLAVPATAPRAEAQKAHPNQMAQTTPMTKTPAAGADADKVEKSAATNPATSQKPESVEQRIKQLHSELKVTPDQETKWNDVAKAMRDNAANMEKLVAEKRQKGPQNMTAVDDLQTYQQFAQAHVDGLKNLTSAFKSLYDAMPEPQKKNADQVFENFHRSPQGRG